MKDNAAGQTLVEVVVVIGVIVVLTTGLVSLTTFSLKNSRISMLKSQAVKYASEGIEFVRQKRDESWTEFQALDGVWCLGGGGGLIKSVCTQNVDNFFSRDVDFIWNAAEERMEVTVTVGWAEGSNYYETDLDTNFTKWQ